MATLQNIRNQGGILVSAFIFIALIAFIAGDALRPGSSLFNRSRNKVAEIAGESIGMQEYNNLVLHNEEIRKMMSGGTASSAEEQRAIQEETWRQLLSKIIMDKEYNSLGLALSSEEVYDALLGDNMDPNLRQLFTDPNTGIVNREQASVLVQQILQFPDGHPDKEYWLFIEDQITTNLLKSKYDVLLSKALYIPTSQVTDLSEKESTKVDISYLVKNYATISDSTVTVTQSEIKEYYNSHQNLFKQEESRQISYVAFDIDPSGDDIAETETWVADLKEEFAETANILEFASLSSEKSFTPLYYKKGELNDEDLDDFIFTKRSDDVYGPYLKDNAYNLLRVAERKMLPDSVRARHILIQPKGDDATAAQKLADSLANLIRNGGDFDQLARRHSADLNTSVNGGDLGWFTYTPAPIIDSLFASKKNEVKVIISQNGYHVMQVTNQSTMQEKVRVGIVAKEISPSQQTMNTIYNKARLFANNLNSVADFDAAVSEANLTKRIATLGKSDYAISNINNAREIVRQAYLAKSSGGVISTFQDSPIFECDNKYIIAVLTSIKEKGVAPLNDVATRIKRELIRKKKGEILAKELQDASVGSESLLSIAQKTGTTVTDANDVSFASFQIPGAGIEPNVIAEVTTMNVGEFSKPIIGNQGVYLAVVTSKTVDPLSQTIEDRQNNMMQMNYYKVLYQMQQALINDANVIDMRYKLY